MIFPPQQNQRIPFSQDNVEGPTTFLHDLEPKAESLFPAEGGPSGYACRWNFWDNAEASSVLAIHIQRASPLEIMWASKFECASGSSKPIHTMLCAFCKAIRQHSEHSSIQFH